MLKEFALGIIIATVCAGCSDYQSKSKETTPSEVAISTENTANAPAEGSEDWLVWVEKSVGTGDGAGHGPDYGSQEWCFVIEKKLFANASGMTPCTKSWNHKVTETLLKKSQ